MERLNLSQRTRIVQFYFENNHSIVRTQRAYRRYFHERNGPSEMTIRNLIHRFQQQCSVSDLPRTRRPRSVFTNANIHRVEDSVQEDAETSTRRRSTQLGVSRTSLRRILRHLRYFHTKSSLCRNCNVKIMPSDSILHVAFNSLLEKKGTSSIVS
nr:unnamed protein product [Callosobruchus chinensis]